AGLDEDRAARSGSEGDSDARVPPEFVLCVLELAELPRREELDPVEAGAADQVRPEDHELRAENEIGAAAAHEDVAALPRNGLLVHPRIDPLESQADDRGVDVEEQRAVVTGLVNVRRVLVRKHTPPR